MVHLDELIAQLAACGLEEREARAYVHLVKTGASKAADLARVAGLKRTEAYQLLARLEGRGLVEGTLERPRVFSAVAPRVAINALAEERARSLRAVEDARDTLAAQLDTLAGGPVERAASFRVLHDANQINGQIRRTLRDATHDIHLVASPRAIARLTEDGFEESLAEATTRGVRARILTEIHPGAQEAIASLTASAEVRHASVPRTMRFLVADDREIIQHVIADPLGGEPETALWIGAPDHVQSQRAHFDELWVHAVPAAARLHELATGTPAPQVQLIRGRFTRTEKLKEMLLRARTDILAAISGADAGRLAPSGLETVLAARARDGVAVRLLVDGRRRGRNTKTPSAGERRAGEPTELPAFVIDGTEALLVIPGDESTGLTAADEHAVWITTPSAVARLRDRLEHAWKNSS